MRIGALYDKLKSVLETHCELKKTDYTFILELDPKTKEKVLTNRQLVALLETISRSVAESPDEKTVAVKIEKYYVLMIMNEMAFWWRDKETEKRMRTALRAECGRHQNISLAVLERMIIEKMEESSKE